MLEALKFVKGAIAKKDFVPALTHFRIQNRTVKGFNGAIGLCAPIACDLNISPNALQFIRALDACEETVSLYLNTKGKLVVQSGDFQIFVDCDDPANYPNILPSGRTVKLDEKLVPALRLMEPLISIDASPHRAWARGLLFSGESCYATNNIILAQYWLGYEFPCRVNIPAIAIRELVRIGEDPVEMQVTDNRLVFRYQDERWLSTQLVDMAWPVEIDAMLGAMDFDNLQPMPTGFWKTIARLVPFGDELTRCYLQGDHISTMADSESAGAGIAQPCHRGGIYNGSQLLNLQELASQFGWDRYPAAVPFTGDNVRGVLAGIAS